MKQLGNGALDTRRWLKWATSFLLALAVSLSSATGCQQQKTAGPPEKVTIAYTTNISSTLLHVAFAKGYFKEDGLEVTPQPHAFGKPALQAGIDGKADLAMAADTPIMFAVMAGKSIAVLATVQTSNRNEAIIARRDRGIAEPRDLKGKRVAVTPGTTSDFFVDIFLTAHGIDRRQVLIIGMKPEEMGAALSAGKIDAASSWQPALMEWEKALTVNGRTFYGEALYTETFCATSRQDFVREHPEAIRKFLRALLKAETFVWEEPEEARRIVGDAIKIDKADLEKIWGIYDFRVRLDQALLVDLEDQTRWAQRNRLVKNSEMPNYLDFIYTDGLQAVRPESVTVIR